MNHAQTSLLWGVAALLLLGSPAQAEATKRFRFDSSSPLKVFVTSSDGSEKSVGSTPSSDGKGISVQVPKGGLWGVRAQG